MLANKHSHTKFILNEYSCTATATVEKEGSSREVTAQQLNNKLITNENLFIWDYVFAMLGTANRSKTRDGL